MDWKVEIRNAIRTGSLAFIACFSANTDLRTTTYQNEELTIAAEEMRLRRPGTVWLLPVRFDECTVPEYDLGAGRTLSSLQRTDLFGERTEQNRKRLVDAVAHLLTGTSPTTQPAAAAQTGAKTELTARAVLNASGEDSSRPRSVTWSFTRVNKSAFRLRNTGTADATGVTVTGLPSDAANAGLIRYRGGQTVQAGRAVDVVIPRVWGTNIDTLLVSWDGGNATLPVDP